jgi:hypothetical protein
MTIERYLRLSKGRRQKGEEREGCFDLIGNGEERRLSQSQEGDGIQ